MSKSKDRTSNEQVMNERPAWQVLLDKLMIKFHTECEKNLHCPQCSATLDWHSYPIQELLRGTVIGCPLCERNWFVQDGEVKECLSETLPELFGDAAPAHN